VGEAWPVTTSGLADAVLPLIRTHADLYRWSAFEQAAEDCVEGAEQFLIEGFELSTTYPVRLGRTPGGGGTGVLLGTWNVQR